MNPSGEGCEYGQGFASEVSEKRCENCKCFQPVDPGSRVCYEYEIVPPKGCKYFEPKT